MKLKERNILTESERIVIKSTIIIINGIKVISRNNLKFVAAKLKYTYTHPATIQQQQQQQQKKIVHEYKQRRHLIK